ncbi:transmembrane protease serine 11C [Caerostris darwini]|uniref:Transmembrane protease serine 11C n=1 Tax=Caerostris darwini TaxID=1538125 RepID=A0AAV4N2V4_9ARAC|nr:transmembrane protease serine 11C [Caerostris darwini]
MLLELHPVPSLHAFVSHGAVEDCSKFSLQFLLIESNFLPSFSLQVTIFNAKGGTYLCGATLIDDRHILTAANCFDGKSLNPEDYSVEIGQTILKTPINPYRIQEIVLHEDYTPFLNNDIAIIRLDEPVKNVSDAVCILEDDNLEEGKLVTLLGWGQLSLSKRTPDRLQVVAGIPVVENRACSAIYKNKNAIYKMKFITNSAFPNGITEDLMCAGREKGGSDACQGDSGGPLLYEFEPDQFALVGIVSFGYQCVQPNSPGVYTRVSYFLPWITQYIESQTQFQLDPRRRPSRVG